MLDSGPCDETKVLGWQSPHMRLTYIATPETASDRPANRHHKPVPKSHARTLTIITATPLTAHPPYEPPGAPTTASLPSMQSSSWR